MFINLTPHAVTICSTNGTILRTIPGPVDKNSIPRISEEVSVVGLHDDIALMTKRYGETVNLPDAQPGVYLIVSGMVRTALPHRYDLVSPGKIVRDAEGKIVGCENFDSNL